MLGYIDIFSPLALLGRMTCQLNAPLVVALDNNRLFIAYSEVLENPTNPHRLLRVLAYSYILRLHRVK